MSSKAVVSWQARFSAVRVSREPRGHSAEFSVSLRPEAQGLGLARRALQTVLDCGPALGYRSVFGIIARDNSSMLKLASRMGFQIVSDPDDRTLLRAEIELGPQ